MLQGNKSIPELVSELGASRPFDVAYRERRGEAIAEISYADLARRVDALARELRDVAGPGQRVAICREPGVSYAVSFLACLSADLVAVPVQARQARSSTPADLLEDPVVRDSGAVAIVTDDALLLSPSAQRARDADSAGHGVAFLQYSSGSTGTPKGVCVTHGNLAANLSAIALAMRLTSNDRALIWLPPYHDMGLIGGVLTPLWAGIPATLMSPMSFLRDPISWLRAVTEENATISGGPNFAYEACVQALKPEHLSALDLSNWSLAFVGSDVVRSSTLARFTEAFAPVGFEASAFLPCYGLAESTLMVSGVARGDEPRLAARDIGHPGPDLVSAGTVVEGSRIRILGSADGSEICDGQVGEIFVKGASVASGYWQQPDLSADTFDAEGWLRTGDLGRIEAGELFVVGRLKDLIIIRGRNIHPEDVEAAAVGADDRLAGRPVAAFAVDDGKQERLVLAIEAPVGNPRTIDSRDAGGVASGADQLAAAVAAAVTNAIGVAPTVEVVRRGQLPRTTSGKVRRAAARELHVTQGWKVLGRTGAPVETSTDALEEALEDDLSVAASVAAGVRAKAVSAAITRWCSRRSGLPVDSFGSRSLLQVGVDSLGFARLQAAVHEGLNVDVALRDLYTDMSIDDLALMLVATPPRPRSSTADSSGQQGRTAGTSQGVSVTPGQRAVLYLEQLHPGTSMHRLVRTFRVKDEFDAHVLRHALVGLVERHPGLRTAYQVEGDEVRAEVRGVPDDLLTVAPAQPADVAEARAWLAVRAKSLDLEAGRLVDVAVAGTATATFVQFALHHVAVDLTSVAILLAELDVLVRAALDGSPAQLPPTTDALAIEERQGMLAGPEGERSREWWATWADDGVQTLALPVHEGRQERGAGAVVGTVDDVDLRAFDDLSRDLGVTPFALLLACLHGVLASFADDTDDATPLVGIPTAGRRTAASRRAVGYLTNPVPTRVRRTGNASFAQYARDTQAALTDVLEHQEFPFSDIVRLVGGSTADSNPLFDVMFVYDEPPVGSPAGVGRLALGDEGQVLRLGPWGLITEAPASVDLPVEVVWEVAWGPNGELRSALRNNGRLDAAMAACLHRSLSEFVARAVADPEVALADLTTCPYELERSATTTSAPDILGAVYQQVLQIPDAVALRHDRAELTYSALWARVCDVSASLRGHNLPRESVVVLALPRTADLVIHMLAVLMADLVYSPLEPLTPHGRRAAIVAEAQPALVITSPDQLAGWEGLCPAVAPTAIGSAATGVPADKPISPAPPHQLAYVLFTSGSTGHPKAVGVTRGGLASFARSAAAMYSSTEMANALASTPVTFDLSVFELIVPLSCGGTIVLQANIFELEGSARRGVVTMISAVTGLARQLADAGVPPAVGTLNTGGEPVPPELVRSLRRAGVSRVRNLYGPSEDTTFSTVADLTDDGMVTVGWPLPESCGRVVDTNQAPRATGAQGQLVLGGAKLARGYIGRPGLTAERFVPDPYGEAGARVYLTGDRVVRGPDGSLVFVGRTDRQVKVGGVRVELDEVEAVLLRHSRIGSAAVLVQTIRGVDVLVAHVATDLTADAVTRHVALHVASAAVPRHVRVVPFLPVTSSGKVDRRALPEVSLPSFASDGNERLTEAELVVADSWAEVFESPAPGPNVDFFAQGGHSLLALRLLSILERRQGVRIPLQKFFEAPTIRALASLVDAGGPPADSAHARPAHTAVRAAPIAAAQRTFWHAYATDPESSAYVLVADIRICGPLDVLRLERALRAVVTKHDALRTVFVDSDLGVEQRLVDVSVTLDPEETDAGGVATVVDEEAGNAFQLEVQPPWRARLMRVSPSEHHLVFAAHHIICDRWSADLFGRDLGACYTADGSRLSGAAPSFLARAASEATDRPDPEAVSWWRERIEQTPLLSLGGETDSSLPRGVAAVADTEIAGGDWARLRELARSAGVTEFMLLAALTWTTLGAQGARPEFAVGVPTAGRDLDGEAELFGCLVNTVVMRANLRGCSSFGSVLEQVKEEVSLALSRGDVPVSELAAEMARHGGHAPRPLFDVLLSVQQAPPSLEMEGLQVEVIPSEPAQAKFDLTIRTLPTSDGGVRVLVEHDRARIATEVAEGVTGRLQVLVDRVLEHGLEANVKPLLSAGELERLETLHSGGPAPHLAKRTVPEIVGDAAAAAPDRVAITSRAGALTYGAIWERARRIAAGLSAAGVARGDVVAIAHGRTPDLLAAALGVLVAGAAYLPLRHDDPVARQDAMLEDAGAVMVLCDEDTAGWYDADLPVCTVADILADGLPALKPVPVGRDDLAYVMFTSGSTGRPKGVCVTHGGVAARVGWVIDNFTSTELAGVLCGTSLGFDISIFELFGTLAARGTVVLADDTLDLMDHPDRERVSLVIAVPSALAVLAEYPDLPSGLQTVCSGGETLTVNLVERLRRSTGCRLVNTYGPTEDTFCTTHVDLEPGVSPVPIGSSLPGSTLALVDDEHQLVPPGAVGEIRLGGVGVSRGYAGAPGLTAQRFVPDPSGEPGSRCYATGDLGRWLPTGVEFLGRLDGQVKIRGHRVEVGEVENALLIRPEIAEAAVVVVGGPGADARLVAFARAMAGSSIDAELVMASVRRVLPTYMVPDELVELSNFPRTSTGKLDRDQMTHSYQARPGKDPSDRESSAEPLGDVEKSLAQLWQELLSVAHVGRHDQFFALGGDSLAAGRMVARVRETFAVHVPLRAVFDDDRLREFARHVSDALHQTE